MGARAGCESAGSCAELTPNKLNRAGTCLPPSANSTTVGSSRPYFYLATWLGEPGGVSPRTSHVPNSSGS